MPIIDAIILGMIQGLTEFIPVSSSGHLILARDLLNIDSIDALAVDAVLQLATTLAILAYFARELKTILRNKILVKAVVIGTVPAVILGLLLEDFMSTTFRSSTLVACTLVLGALLMWAAEYFGKQDRELSVKNGLVIGLFQSLALVPGMSRSGASIAGGLFSGLTREDAARFSFLLAFPILFGSGIKKLFELEAGGVLSSIGASILVGSIVAFGTGLVAIHFLIAYLKNNKLTPFIWYRIILAVLILVFI